MNTYRAKIDFVLVPAGPVLISSGSGNKFHPELPDNTFLVSWDGECEAFVIPGSSTKGVIRHYLYSLYNNDAVDTLFGYVDKNKGAKKSKLSVSDSFAKMSTTKTAVRHSTALGSVSQSAKNGSLNNMQVVTDGRFPCCITLTDSTNEEILMLIKAVKAIDNGDICIGGKISRGFGRMNVMDFSIVISGGYDTTTLRPIITDRFDSIDTAEKEIESLMKKTKGATV